MARANITQSNKYNVYCDSVIETVKHRDVADSPELIDDRGVAGELGENAARAINGLLGGLLGEGEDE